MVASSPQVSNSAHRRRLRYSMLPLSRPQLAGGAARRAGLRREAAFCAVGGAGLRREGAFSMIGEPQLSPTSLAIASRYRKPVEPALVSHGSSVESPERTFFLGARSGARPQTDYTLKYRSPSVGKYRVQNFFAFPSLTLSIESLSPPSSPTPMVKTPRPLMLSSPHSCTLYRSPLSAPPSDPRFNRTVEHAKDVTTPKQRDFSMSCAATTPQKRDFSMVDSVESPTPAPLEHTPMIQGSGHSQRTQPHTPLQLTCCKRLNASPQSPCVYILGNERASGIPLHRIRKPYRGEFVSFHPTGDSFEMQVDNVGVDENIKMFHSLNLVTDVKIRCIHVKKMSHYVLSARVIGTAKKNVGLTLEEFEDFCAQCARCNLYSSRRSLESFHDCPSDSPCVSPRITFHPMLLTTPDDKKAAQTPTFRIASRVNSIYDRFHAVPKCQGITAEEVQYLFVVCKECDRVMTRTAALDHAEEMDWESLI